MDCISFLCITTRCLILLFLAYEENGAHFARALIVNSYTSKLGKNVYLVNCNCFENE